MSYIIIAGPQAAGKSTTIRRISNENPLITPYLTRTGKVTLLKEGREIIGKKHNSLGAIFMSKEQEREVIEADLKRISNLERDSKEIYIDESSVFTLAHAALHGIPTTDYFKEYLALLHSLNARVIFLDAPPSTSWQRRKNSYASRVSPLPDYEQSEVMQEYQRYMNGVYPELLKLFNNLNLPKFKIDATKSPETTLRETRSKLSLILT